MGVGNPASVNSGTGRTNHAAQCVSQRLNGGLEALGTAQATAAGDDDLSAFQVYLLAFHTIKSKMAANKAKIPVLSAADCGLDVERSGLKGSPTKVKKSFTPPRKEGGLKIKEETPEESAKKLYDLLKDKGII